MAFSCCIFSRASWPRSKPKSNNVKFKRWSVSMKPFLTLAPLAIFVSACGDLPTTDAVCTGTEGLRKAHAGALLADGGPMSLDTGERLLSGLKAGCSGD